MNDDVKWCSSSMLRSASSRGASRRNPRLEACHPFGDNGQVKMYRWEALPLWSMGEKYVDLHQAKRNQERWSTWEDQVRHHLVKWNAQGKGMILIGFLFYRSHVVSRETRLLDRHRTIKRGSRLSFSVSVGESSNLCILASSSFLVLIWLISLWGFGACCDFHNKLKFTENGFRMKNLLYFRFWSFSRFIFYREVSPFYIWFYTPLLDYDVFLHHLVVLVVVIPTSPRTSKTEFGYSRYARFSVGVFLQFLHGR